MSSAEQQKVAPEAMQDFLVEERRETSTRSSRGKAPTVAEILAKLLEMGVNIGYDRVADRPMKTGTLPWDPTLDVRPWGDVDDARLYSLLQEEIGLRKRSDMDIALTIASDDGAFDPLMDLLESLSWDGEERAECLFIDYLGADDTPFTREATKVFLCEGLARAFHPGIKADYLVILAGKGGLGKSTLVRKLALEDRYFTDCSVNLGDVKLTGELNRGKWIVELPELSGMNNRNIEAVKAAVTRQADEFRGAYCRRTASFPRRVVYVGTTNEVDFIREKTSGARRFLPILCGVAEPKKSIFVPDAKVEMRQVWAEVHTWMVTGDPRFSTVLSPEMEAEAAAQRACFMDDDPREQVVKTYLAENEDHLVCTFEIIEKALHMERTNALSKEVSSILSNRCPGWVLVGKRLCGAYGKQRCWEKR